MYTKHMYVAVSVVRSVTVSLWCVLLWEGFSTASHIMKPSRDRDAFRDLSGLDILFSLGATEREPNKTSHSSFRGRQSRFRTPEKRADAETADRCTSLSHVAVDAVPDYFTSSGNIARLMKKMCDDRDGVVKSLRQTKSASMQPTLTPRQLVVMGLTRRADRRIFMRKKLSGLDLEISFFDAVDCRSDAACMLYYTSVPVHPNFNVSRSAPPSVASVGILHSWRKLLAEQLITNAPHMIVLEDDVYLSKFERVFADWKFLSSKIMAYMGGHQTTYDIRQLRAQNAVISANKTGYYHTFSNLRVTDNWGITFGAYGVILSRPMMGLLFYCIQFILEKPHRYLAFDVLLNAIIRHLRHNVPVIYPNAVVPEVRDSENMGSRDLEKFGAERRISYENAEYLNEFEVWRNNSKLAAELRPQLLWGADGLLGNSLSHLNTFGLNFMRFGTLFAIVVTAYNVEDIIHNLINSVCSQEYPYYRLIIYDDASTDQTVKKIWGALQLFPKCFERSTILRSPTHFGQSLGRQAAVRLVHDAEVVMMVDGDDFLLSNKSLGQLEHIFHDEKHWPINFSTGKPMRPLMTYGNFVRLQNGIVGTEAGNVKHFTREVIENNDYRNRPWTTNHPRVAIGYLAKSVPNSAVMDWNCNWLVMNSDLAQSFFMLEHSGGASIRTNISLYVYNMDHSLATPNSYYKPENKDIHLKYQSWVRGKLKTSAGKTILDYAATDPCSAQAEKDLEKIFVERLLVNE